LEFQIKYR